MNGEEEINDLLWQASQDYEQSLQASQQSQSPGSLHFASPLSSKELFSKVEESVPENMRSNTKWAGIEGFFTNHSLRRPCASRRFQEGTEEQVIMSVTGHRSVDGVRSYKKISDKQLQATSDILQLKKGNIKLNEECDKENEKPQERDLEVTKGAMYSFTSCTVNIYNK